MSRSYRHISEYEQEIIELRGQGFSGRQICEKLGFAIKQYRNFVTRYNNNQKKIEAGISLKRKGRPPKDYFVSEQDTSGLQ